jgi:protein-tyrosine-phosphatase
MFNKSLLESIRRFEARFDAIPTARKQVLAQLADYGKQCLGEGRPIKFIFICTHNSRRSHLSQVAMQTAGLYYGIPGVMAYSGGTEVTAMNPRAVASLQRAGWLIHASSDAANPVYQISFTDDGDAFEAFSKVYSDAANPPSGFAAVMTCNSADQACPVVLGADVRISLPFVDPKEADDTPQEAEVYDERTHQISTEIFYAASLMRS